MLDGRGTIETSAVAARPRTPSAFLRVSLACVTLSVLTSGGARAQVEDRLADCARIAGSDERLACYDALSQARRSAAKRDWNGAFGLDASRGSTVAAESGAAQADDAANFGFDDRGSGGPAQVESRYDGEFTGWSGNTLFRLENGQVWKQAQSGRVSARAGRPKVTIKRATLGGYRMSVEGLNETIRVERVR
jgi:hypothetical protein